MIKGKRLLILWLSILALAPSAARASVAELASGTSQAKDGGFGSAIIDTVGGFAYFASSTSFLVLTSTFSDVVPVTLSPFSVNAGAAYFNAFTELSVAAFDSGTRYSYYVSSGAPAAIELIPFTGSGVPVSSMTFAFGQNWIGTGVIDSTHHMAYFGTLTSPSIVIGVQLPDGVSVSSMTVVSSITLPSGLDFLSASVIDTANGFAYFASSAPTGAVAKIQIPGLTLAGRLTFSAGEGGVGSAVLDTTKNIAYFGTHDSPGKVVQVQLSDFSRVGALTLLTGENDLTSAVIDPARGFAYFGTNTAPGIVAQVGLSNFLERPSVTLKAGEDFLTSAVIDPANAYAYFGTYTTPGHVIQMDLLAGPPTILVQPSNANVHAGETAAFYITADGRGLSYQWQINGVDIPGATSTSYSRPAAPGDDGTSFRCVVTGANGSVTSTTAQLTIIPVVRAYPNPWRLDRHSGVSITFDGLLPNSTVKIFTLAAHWVKTLPMASGSVTWNLTNDSGETVASGYYFYVVSGRTDKQTSTGKIAIIR